MITRSFLYFCKKNLKKIEQIVTSSNKANMLRKIIGQSRNLTIIAKKKKNSY